MKPKDVLTNGLILVVTTLFCFGAAEILLRIKNADMRNYDIEMWDYSRKLKTQVPDRRIDFVHVPNASAVLQSVTIRTNEWGLRGGPVTPKPAPGTRRVLVLGNSIALGWGVPEEQTIPGVLQKQFNEARAPVEVLNGGVGNYNAERYVRNFLSRLAPLEPTDILILATGRDGVALQPGGGNLLLRHSQLAVALWSAGQGLRDRGGKEALVDRFRETYAPGSNAMATMEEAFVRLAEHATAHGIRVILAMVPDTRVIADYPFEFIHAEFARIADRHGFTFIDLLPALQRLPPSDLWATPDDPHPSAIADAAMARMIFPVLAAQIGSDLPAAWAGHDFALSNVR